MIDKISKLLHDFMQNIEEQLHILLQERSLVDDIDKTTRENVIIWVRIPLRVNLYFSHNNKLLLSI